ncbi:MAG: response regulator [Proteobacteria bacterium]|nr:response regulator [Pseudomonadota bacterium]MBU1741877.1 response regulator [Pseudomonadota bacterium]
MSPRAVVAETDGPTSRRMAELLRAFGYEVVTADTGRAVLDLVAADRPDLIVLDVYLPDLLGTSVCHQIKDGHDRPGIIITSFKTFPIEEKIAAAAGADALLRKPLKDEELTALVRDLAAPPGEGP